MSRSITEKRLLVVDDEESIRNVMVRLFSTQGYQVVTAASAEEALELLQHDKFFLCFFDLNLTGMDGVELGERVRSQNPLAVLYAMTGYKRMFEVVACRQAGFDDYFEKPFRLNDLREAAEQAMQRLARWDACMIKR